MRIGDEVFIHGYVDEIRKDMVIIRNSGGYFATVPHEIKCEAPAEPVGYWAYDVEQKRYVCPFCGYNTQWLLKTTKECPICERRLDILKSDMKEGENDDN